MSQELTSDTLRSLISEVRTSLTTQKQDKAAEYEHAIQAGVTLALTLLEMRLLKFGYTPQEKGAFWQDISGEEEETIEAAIKTPDKSEN
jgi:hypothetical protein